MLQGKSVIDPTVESDDPVPPGSCDPGSHHDIDYAVTGGAGSDEFSPTASPGSPLDSDEALDDLPPELLCGSDVMLDEKSGLQDIKDETTSAVLLTAVDHTQAKHHSKVLLCVCLSVCLTLVLNTTARSLLGNHFVI